MDLCLAQTATRVYYDFSYPGAVVGSQTLLTGIRGTSLSQVVISGFYIANGQTIPFLYQGDLSGNGHWQTLTYASYVTNLYGPDILPGGNVRVVGNYFDSEGVSIAVLYQGPVLHPNPYGWTPLLPEPEAQDGIAHSTGGGLVVGNYLVRVEEIPVQRAFIYDILANTYTRIEHENAVAITAYGIWYNEPGPAACSRPADGLYTIAGGFVDRCAVESAAQLAFLVDWDNIKKVFSNWRSYRYDQHSTITHFDGITSDGFNGYNLVGDHKSLEAEDEVGFFAHVARQADGSFGEATWSSLQFGPDIVTSGNSVYQEVAIGVTNRPNDDTIRGYVSVVVG